MSIYDAQSKLRILYGLSQNEPTPYQIRKWRERVRALMDGGLSSDDAGDRAAQENLHDRHDAVLLIQTSCRFPSRFSTRPCSGDTPDSRARA